MGIGGVVLPAKCEIQRPRGGWEERCYYLVDVSYGPSNPIHRAIFFTGFLDDGEPGGYSNLWGSYDYPIPFNSVEVYYLKPIRLLTDVGEMDRWRGNVGKKHQIKVSSSMDDRKDERVDGLDWGFILFYPLVPAAVGAIVGWMTWGPGGAFAGALLGVLLGGVAVLVLGGIWETVIKRHGNGHGVEPTPKEDRDVV